MDARITRSAPAGQMDRQDEGIVQPISKEMELAVPPPPPMQPSGFQPEGFLSSPNRSRRCCSVLSSTSAAYIAGLIDGEGTITLSHRHSNEQRHLVVSIVSTEKPMLEFARAEIGVGKMTTKCTTKMHHARSFTFSITNQQALDLLVQIVGYLRSYKAGPARLALPHYRRLTPRNGKYTAEQIKERRAFVDEFLALRPDR